MAILLAGCEKNINFKLKDEPPQMVVEATIENDQWPIVLLSHSVGFFSQISINLLENIFVHDAEVYISDGSLTHKLKEYTVPVAPGLNLYYYSIDSAHLNTAFRGTLSHAYSLRIVSGGQEYNANTTIPQITKKIDSIWWKPAPANSDTTKVVVMVRATDKKGFGNYVRYFTKRNNEPFYPPLNSVFDDLFIDGTTYELQLDPGVDRNAPRNDDEHYFNRGDTVTLKLCEIDKATFDFWRTMEYSYASIGNPFSTPTTVLSNISNNALGYFGGYAAQFRTLVIQH